MPQEVFISYARTATAEHAQALAAKLGEVAFLDTDAIDDGDQFPPRLLNGLLSSRVVVVFATKAYSERRFCRLEMRLALAAGDPAMSRLVLGLGEGSGFVVDAMPESIGRQSWPPTEATERLEKLVRHRLAEHSAPLRSVLVEAEAQRLAAAFLEESNILEPRSLDGIVCSLPQGVASRSIGSRFIGRAGELRRIHQILSDGSGVSARLTSRIAAGAGFGKTRLATEYLYRYGARYYPGGLFWVNAASSSVDDEFWRILSVLDPSIPNLAEMRKKERGIRHELERALRAIHAPVLYVIDNIPEAGPGEDAAAIQDFCPALGAVTVLATSRQDTREEGVKTIPLDTPSRDAAILLLTDNLPGASRLSWSDWGHVANWVGDLPLALDLLNRCLALNSISIENLFQRATSVSAAPGEAEELEGLREALRGQVPRDSVRGVVEALGISFEKLEQNAQLSAMLLAQLAPAPIPEALIDALPEAWKTPAIRTALRSRHFVTASGSQTFGVMHRLVADFLRQQTGDLKTEFLGAACSVVEGAMKIDRCEDPLKWPVMNLFRPHAAALVDRADLTSSELGRATRVGKIAAMLAFVQADYAEHRRLYEKILAMTTRALGEENPDTLWAMSGYARSLRHQGDYKRAQQFEERVLEIRVRVWGEEDIQTLRAMSDLAETLCMRGKYVEAQRLQERVLEQMARVIGAEHPDTLSAMSDLAETLNARGEYVKSQRLKEHVLELRIRVPGEENPDRLSAMSEQAAIRGDHAESRRLKERVLELHLRERGEGDLATLRAMSDLATFLSNGGDLAQAQALEQRALELKKHLVGESHPLTVGSMERLAGILFKLGNYKEAQRLRERVIEAELPILGKEHPQMLRSLDLLADTLLAQGNVEGTRRLQEQILETRMRVVGAEHPDTLTSMSLLAVILLKSGDFKNGLQLLRQCVAGRRRVLGDQHPDTTYTAEVLLRFEREQQSRE
jgi:tetratricopeptide (TPR) repeat protein